MSWKTPTLVQQRLDFVTLASSQDANISELCRRFAISRKTGHKWLRRYRKEGAKALADQSRAPKKSPRQIQGPAADACLDLRRQHPAWGPRKLHRRLADLGRQDLPAISTFARLIKRAGLIDNTSTSQPFQRFERPRCNDLWQMDFKGYLTLADTTRCHPLGITDDHSRYNLCLAPCADQSGATVKPLLISTFTTHGLPAEMLCDNGPPWGRTGGEWSSLTVWLLRLGVKVLHGRPYHPQTQGKQERFHRTLKAELLSRHDWKDLDQAKARFASYRDLYNHERPHQALGLDTPAKHYQPSRRSYPNHLPLPEYDVGEIVRTVKSKGEITFQNRFFYIGRAFEQLPLALRPILPEGHYHVCLNSIVLGRIDLTTANDRPKGNCYPLLPLEQHSALCVTHVSEHL